MARRRSRWVPHRARSVAPHGAPAVRLLRAALCALACAMPSLPAAGDKVAGTIGAGAGDARLARVSAPDFTLPGTSVEVRLADYRGEVVYVDFWASWCAPCLQSFPWMNTLAERYRADGLRILAINLDTERAAAERFLADVRTDFGIAFDPAGASAEAFGLLGMPSSFVIDRDGRIASTHVGFLRKDAPLIEAVIERVLAEPVRERLILTESEEP